MNMMKYCPECYKELPPNSASCPFCGYRSAPEEQPQANGTTPQKIRTPLVDSYIPPEQTMLSLLLLMIFFWGINIAITAIPIFLDAGTIRNILIAGISSQVVTRVIIGLWAVEEQSLKRDSTTNKQVAYFLLAFIPLGGIYAFLHAARTTVRKDRLSNMTISAIFSVLLMSVILFASQDGITTLITGQPPESVEDRPDPTQTVIVVENTEIPPTPTLRVYQGGCRNPSSVTPDEEGEEITVCGTVTNFGDNKCENCPNGFFSYIKLDGDFQIVSYNYHFSFAFLDDCIAVKDKVEIYGDEAVFQYNDGEECTTNEDGELVCDEGTYFQDYTRCR
jgi:hypothetical protein